MIVLGRIRAISLAIAVATLGVLSGGAGAQTPGYMQLTSADILANHPVYLGINKSVVIDLPRPAEFLFRYDVMELSTAVKPYLLRQLFARGHGLWLESELGTVGGKDGSAPLPPHASGARTDPAQAAAYVAATGVDALAVAVGSSHAMTSRDASLDLALVAELLVAVDVPLVLHGSSGVSDEQLQAAVKAGIVKVNIGTALNIAATAAVRDVLAADGSVVDPRRYLAPARGAMAAAVAHFLQLLAVADPEVV